MIFIISLITSNAMENKSEQLKFVMNLVSSIETEWTSQQITFAFSDPKQMLQTVGIFNSTSITADHLAMTKVRIDSLISHFDRKNNIYFILWLVFGKEV
jgi:hypothetical protein